MAYLSQPTSKTDYGVVLVGDFINVDVDGIISIPQSVDPTADVTFATITDSSLTEGRVTFAGPDGLLTDDGELTYDPTTDTLSVVNISVSGTLELDGDSVITSVTPSAGNGISITSLVSTGPDASFTVNNTGVLSLTAGTGITLSGSTGNITVSAVGADIINTYGTTTSYTASATDEYIGVDSTSLVTITLPAGVTGRVYTIKDEHGMGFGKINVVGTGGELIDAVTPYVINVPKQSITVVFRAGNWHII